MALKLDFYLLHVCCLNTILPFTHTINTYILGAAGSVVSPFLHRHCSWGDRQTIIKVNKTYTRRRHIYNLVINDKEVNEAERRAEDCQEAGVQFYVGVWEGPPQEGLI